jgi:hypothetical protein
MNFYMNSLNGIIEKKKTAKLMEIVTMIDTGSRGEGSFR